MTAPQQSLSLDKLPQWPYSQSSYTTRSHVSGIEEILWCVSSTVLCWGQHPHYSPIPIIYSVDGNCFPLTVCQANRKASSMASLLPYWVFALATVRAALWLACWYSCSMYSKPVSVTRDQTPTSFLFYLTYDCCVVECTIRQVLHHLFECRKS